MTTRQDVVDFCLAWEDAYADAPFRDDNWTVMRHKSNKKGFAFIYEYQGRMQVNVKCRPGDTAFWRGAYPDGVLPGYHMNKAHWNTIVLGRVPAGDVKGMIAESFRLTGKPERITIRKNGYKEE